MRVKTALVIISLMLIKSEVLTLITMTFAMVIGVYKFIEAIEKEMR